MVGTDPVSLYRWVSKSLADGLSKWIHPPAHTLHLLFDSYTKFEPNWVNYYWDCNQNGKLYHFNLCSSLAHIYTMNTCDIYGDLWLLLVSSILFIYRFQPKWMNGQRNINWNVNIHHVYSRMVQGYVSCYLCCMVARIYHLCPNTKEIPNLYPMGWTVIKISILMCVVFFLRRTYRAIFAVLWLMVIIRTRQLLTCWIWNQPDERLQRY